GDAIERYLFISIERYGVSWFARPLVAFLFALAIIGLVRPLLADVRRQGGAARMVASFGAPAFHVSQLFTLFILAVSGVMVVAALPWDFSAKIVPLVVGCIGFATAALSLFNDMCRRPQAAVDQGVAADAEHQVQAGLHMDLTSDTEHLPVRTIAARAAWFFGYLVAFMAVMAVIGLIPTAAVFVVFFMRFEGKERWSLVLPYTVGLGVGVYI